MKFRFIYEHVKEFSVRVMCRVLGVSPSGYYAWCPRPESARSREDRRLRIKIRAFHVRSRGRYGSARIREDLLEDNETCGRNRVARLMREDGLVGKKAQQFRKTTQSDHADPVAPNLLDQNFTVETPNTVWAGDITYLRTREGWLYLAVLLDLYSRLVVGWSLSTSLEHELALDALHQAVAQRRPGPGLVHHSDRGCQYTCGAYQDRLKELGMKASMSGKGNCYDNAVVESFFDSLKTEIGEETFESREHAREAVFEYIEIFYNRHRRHSTLGYLSPSDFERQPFQGPTSEVAA
jgi:transposase InsO family protein